MLNFCYNYNFPIYILYHRRIRGLVFVAFDYKDVLLLTNAQMFKRQN